MDERRECRVAALRLAVEFYRGRDATDVDIELKADKFYKYITTGQMHRR